MKILFVSRWYPYPPDNGSKIRVFNLIRQLSSRHEIDLISFTTETMNEEKLAGMQRYCRNVWVTEYKSNRNGRAGNLLGYLSPMPRSLVGSYSPKMQRLIDGAGQSGRYDLLISSQVDMAPYVRQWQWSPKVFEELELTTLYEHSIRGRSRAHRFRNSLTWWKYSNYLPGLLRKFAGCTVVSVQEREHVLKVAPGACPVEVIPNGVDTAYYRGEYGEREADTLVYSGALTYFANLNAMQYFLREIFPSIRARRPSVRLRITGSTENVPLERLGNTDGVEFTGYLDDIRPAVARSQVNIVPLKIGGGTRLKILEALALGTPVVSTAKGAEGLNLVAGRDLLVADSPADFADAVLQILENPPFGEMLARQGQQTVERQYDWKIVAEQLEMFLQRVAA